jgi:hypothetical protein
MRWEDERYVRLYTRDSADWLGLSFPAQGLFCLLLRKVDRAGLLALGKQGRKAIAITVGHASRWAELEPALEELLVDGCVRLDGDHLVIPNFLEAQEAPQSDAQRKRESRARARDLASSQNVTGAGRNGTSGHETGQKVTSGHTASHAVTPSLAYPPVTSRDEPSSASASAGRSRAKRDDTDPRFAPLKAAWLEEFTALRHAEYRWSPADAVGLHRVIAVPVDEFRERARRGLGAIGFLRCGTVAKLTSNEVWNQLAGDVPPAAGPPAKPRVVAGVSNFDDPAVRNWRPT